MKKSILHQSLIVNYKGQNHKSQLGRITRETIEELTSYCGQYNYSISVYPVYFTVLYEIILTSYQFLQSVYHLLWSGGWNYGFKRVTVDPLCKPKSLNQSYEKIIKDTYNYMEYNTKQQLIVHCIISIIMMFHVIYDCLLVILTKQQFLLIMNVLMDGEENIMFISQWKTR